MICFRRQLNKSPIYAKSQLWSPPRYFVSWFKLGVFVLQTVIFNSCWPTPYASDIICLVALGTLNRAGLFCWRLYYPSATKHGCDIIHFIYSKTTKTTTKSLLMGMQCYEGKTNNLTLHLSMSSASTQEKKKICRYSPFIRNSAVKQLFLSWM